MWHDADGMGWWMVWGMAMMILFWGVIVALAVWLVQSLTQRDRGGDALDIARQRLARGEISPEEFDKIRAAITSK